MVLRDGTSIIGTEGWDKEDWYTGGWDKEEFGTEIGTRRTGTEGWDKEEWY